MPSMEACSDKEMRIRKSSSMYDDACDAVVGMDEWCNS